MPCEGKKRSECIDRSTRSQSIQELGEELRAQLPARRCGLGEKNPFVLIGSIGERAEERGLYEYGEQTWR